MSPSEEPIACRERSFLPRSRSVYVAEALLMTLYVYLIGGITFGTAVWEDVRAAASVAALLVMAFELPWALRAAVAAGPRILYAGIVLNVALLVVTAYLWTR